MYHAEVKLIKTVKPVAVEGRAPWPKLKIRCSFELQHVEEICGEKSAPDNARPVNMTYAQLVAASLCASCRITHDKSRGTLCPPCADKYAAKCRETRAAKAARFT